MKEQEKSATAEAISTWYEEHRRRLIQKDRKPKPTNLYRQRRRLVERRPTSKYYLYFMTTPAFIQPHKVVKAGVVVNVYEDMMMTKPTRDFFKWHDWFRLCKKAYTIERDVS